MLVVILATVVLAGAQSLLALLTLGFLDPDVVASELHVRETPVVHVLVPLSSSLDPHILEGGDELVDQQMLQPDFPRQLTDSIHEVFSLSVDFLLQVVQLIASLDHFAGKLLGQLLFNLEFILLRGVSLFNIKPLLILSFKLLLQPHLHDPLLLELTFGLH